jgi:hypothetical protein
MEFKTETEELKALWLKDTQILDVKERLQRAIDNSQTVWDAYIKMQNIMMQERRKKNIKL